MRARQPISRVMSQPDRDYVLEVKGLDEQVEGARLATADRRWIGVRFDCCGVYQRLYKSPDGSAYGGHCPRCLRKVRVRVGPEGTDARFFSAR